MENTFKVLFITLSMLLVLSIALVSVTVPFYKTEGFQLDFYDTNLIVDNIKNMEMNMTSIIYIKNSQGNWEEYERLHGEENRIWVPISKMPKDIINAFIAIEDETFYEHKGINFRRTLGALGNFLFKFDDQVFGGSTITQQLIKNITNDKSQTATRKFREIIRALLLETKISKEKILETYLNTIGLCNGICGVEVAANYYFNKSVEDLTLLECVCIASITQHPEKYNPIRFMENNKSRRNIIFDKMLELGMISQEEYDANYDKDLELDNTQREEYENRPNSYFTDAIIEQVIADLAEKYKCDEGMASSMLYNGGYKIYSTMNPEIQGVMEDIYGNVKTYFNNYGKNLAGERVHIQSAMTVMDYNGHIVGLMGGAGEKNVDRALNRAIDAPRQPGSTMKPLGVYALAIEKDIIHYTSKVKDEPIEYYYPDGKKGPREWYGYYKGTITVDYALRKSANTIPVKLLKEMGIDDTYKFLTEKLKFKYINEKDKDLSSLALGGCSLGITTTESASAYAIFGNQGVFHKPTTYYKIEKTNGDIVLEYDDKGEQVISPATATIMNHLLQGVVYGSEGTGHRIKDFSKDFKAYAKTGTSSNANDVWMVAGTPYYIGSVWYGFDMQQKVQNTAGAATIWREVMKKVHENLEEKDFTDSEDVEKIKNGWYKKGSKPDNLYTIRGSAKPSEDTSSTTSGAATANPPAASSTPAAGTSGTTSTSQ